MIITLTLNPSLDRAVEIDCLRRGEVIRARGRARWTREARESTSPGRCWPTGWPRVPSCPAAVRKASSWSGCCAPRVVDPVCVRIGGHTRSNLTLAEPDGTITKINEPGPALTAADLEAVLAQALAFAADSATGEAADWVVVCGSRRPDCHPARSLNCASTSSPPGYRWPSTPAARRCAPPQPPAPNSDQAQPRRAGRGGRAPARPARRRGRRRRTSCATAGGGRRAGQPRCRRCRPRRRRRRPRRRAPRSPSRAARSAPATPCSPGSSPPGREGSRRPGRGAGLGRGGRQPARQPDAAAPATSGATIVRITHATDLSPAPA